MNYTDVSKSIAAVTEKIGEPLSPLQELVLVGSIAVWLERARRQGQMDVQGRIPASRPNDPEVCVHSSDTKA